MFAAGLLRENGVGGSVSPQSEGVCSQTKPNVRPSEQAARAGDPLQQMNVAVAISGAVVVLIALPSGSEEGTAKLSFAEADQ